MTLDWFVKLYNIFLNPCPVEPDLWLFENTVDPDQLASVEAI